MSAQMFKTPRLATTIVLVRQQHGDLQVYLLKRSTESSFFPGFYVFPGGTVNAEDQGIDKWMKHIDLDPDSIPARFGGGLSVEDAIAFGVSAIRETFEEAGVMLSAKNSDSQTLQKINQERKDRDLEKDWLYEWVLGEKRKLAFSRMTAWSHWITPEAFKQRFDTRFFIARMPSGQECSPDEYEMTHGIWITPEQGLTMNQKGTIPLSPPTIVTLHELLSYPALDALEKELELHPLGQVREPRMIPSSKGAVILQPWDPMVHEDSQTIINDLGYIEVPVGEPFSRLWLDHGIWRPIER